MADHHLEEELRQVKESQETLCEEIIRSRLDEIRRLDREYAKLVIFGEWRRQRKRSRWYRIFRWLGEDDSYVDALYETTMLSNRILRDGAQMILDSAIKWKRALHEEKSE